LYKKDQHLHFIGIGGSGMCGIAEVLLTLGYRVSGSDLHESDSTRRLASLGAVIRIGHSPENVGPVHVVVVSSAVQEDNVEVLEARKQGIPVIPRAEMLAELMRMKHGIAVAGSHGKTTTTSLIAAILEEAGMDPTYVVGGKLLTPGVHARLGTGKFLVAEADESDGSFLHLAPAIAVITNIDAEHLDHYGDVDRLKEAFRTFLGRVPFYGLDVLCIDQEHVQSLIPSLEKRFVTYGFSAQADYRARSIRQEGLATAFEVWKGDERLGAVRIPMPGLHMVSNVMAAMAVADELEVPFPVAARALDAFEGIQRRFEQKGSAGDITVLDDYGHHPTEIRATLEAARGVWDRRIIVAFQPHRYTRTRDCYSEFLGAFHQADELILTGIYPAGEEPIEGVSAEKLWEGIRSHGHRSARYEPNMEKLPELLLTIVKPGDLVITLGAGNIYTVGEALLERLAAEEVVKETVDDCASPDRTTREGA